MDGKYLNVAVSQKNFFFFWCLKNAYETDNNSIPMMEEINLSTIKAKNKNILYCTCMNSFIISTSISYL